MGKIYVVRHGQSTWNAEQRWAGHANPVLTELGRQQAVESCAELGDLNFTGVCSSCLLRARETAAIISKGIAIELLEPVADLNEQHYGELSGLTSSEIKNKYPDFMARRKGGKMVEIPGGEIWETFVSRVFKGFESLLTRPGNTLVVAHLGVLRAIEHNLNKTQSKHKNLDGLWLSTDKAG